MLEFDVFLARYGEVVVQDIIEQTERFLGVRANVVTPLEERWNALMREPSAAPYYALAA